MGRIKTAQAARQRRHIRTRTRIVGVAGRPRLNVYRSLNHIYAQVIDDSKGHTIAAARSNETAVAGTPKTVAARQVGKLLAERAQAEGVRQVVFDRGGYKYHGRVKALADGAREEGLEF
jgi:large subunit ribosomal protein L18